MTASSLHACLRALAAMAVSGAGRKSSALAALRAGWELNWSLTGFSWHARPRHSRRWEGSLLYVAHFVEFKGRLGLYVGDAQPATAVEHRQQLRKHVLRSPALGQQRLRRQRVALPAGAHQEPDVLIGGDEVWRQPLANTEIAQDGRHHIADHAGLGRILLALGRHRQLL